VGYLKRKPSKETKRSNQGRRAGGWCPDRNGNERRFRRNEERAGDLTILQGMGETLRVRSIRNLGFARRREERIRNGPEV